MSRAILALALLPAAAALDMCENSEAYMPDAYFKSKCGLTSTADDISCPGLCSSGQGGVDTSGGTYNYEKGAGYCSGGLDETPAALESTYYFTLDTCWNSCVDEFGSDTFDSVEYECNQNACWCYCLSSCSCMIGVGATSTARLAADTDPLPGACDDDDYTYDDDGMILDEGYYYCYCQDYDADEDACSATLGGSAEAFVGITCATMQEDLNEYDTSVCPYQDEIFEDDMGEACCSDGLNGCYSTCQSSMSTVTRQSVLDGRPEQVPLTEVKIGDKLLAANHGGQTFFDEVEGLPSSPSDTTFVNVTVVNKLDGEATTLRVTPHHTVAVCSAKKGGEVKEARKIKAGDCVLTASGKGRVESVKTTAATEGESTFTVELKGHTELLVVDGILTHAKPEHKQLNHKEATKAMTSRFQAASLRGAPKQPPAHKATSDSGFSAAVIGAVERKIKAHQRRDRKKQQQAL